METPIIETERLRLRGHRLLDFKVCTAMWADERVCRYIGGQPFPEDHTWKRILAYNGHWSLLGYGFWAVEEKSSGHFIGELGFGDFKRDIQPSIAGFPEAGWAFLPEVHGRGYASEALQAVMSWGYKKFGPIRTVCLIGPDNEPSLKLAKKFSFREFARTTHKGQPAIMFERILG